MTELTLFLWLNKLNKQTDIKGQHTSTLFNFGGPCHLSNSVLGSYLPLRTACLFSYALYYYLINTIPSLSFFFKTLSGEGKKKKKKKKNTFWLFKRYDKSYCVKASRWCH